MKLDVLFIHKGRNQAPKILVMPMGLVVLADFLKQNKYNPRIINYDIEKSIDPQFDIIDYLKKTRPRLVCLSLHWHQQSFSVINLAKHIKRSLPDTLILFGGFTASYYHKQIISNYSFVDFIIRGDGEVPLLKLVENIFKNGNYSKVPNLTWREKGSVKINDQSYAVSPKIFNNLNFANFNLVKNYKYCFLRDLLDSNMDIRSLKLNYKNLKKVFFFNCGRGCLVNCSYCGGGACAQKKINHREGIVLMDLKNTVKQLKEANNYGIKWWFTDFFPHNTDSYYNKLFKKIREEKLKLRCTFSCWHLPDEKFVYEFSKTFTKESELEISPDTGSERIRFLNKGYYFTNKELTNVLEKIYQLRIKCSVHFATSLPLETKKDSLKTRDLIKYIKKEFSEFEIVKSPIEIEPASPWQEKGDDYGVTHEKNSFESFFK